ncbi:N-acetylmuramidase domain-containing protein [Cohaesibacter gelatinilyticus]|uniref:Putative peptidoglycan binding domain-containing protein n=1 Tax=Cohaesibacter gelatinilyticus TaxID=372072 RepID=A0A285PGV0_9HYPH|nr:N-acetylmuramidase domain-containing protein [Cohaesibacter gelatinilyticus]SNZ20960.1 Putative peptidoglycan binding domain-containing protein [Cohaesibacter gelatinilyticus]
MFTQEVRNLVDDEAKRLNISPAALLSVIEVESAGVSLWSVGHEKLPPIRFEGHYFYRLLSPEKRKIAVRQGLAHSKAGRVKNPRSYKARYALFERAMKIDMDAAIQSISMGLGQVMGAHWERLGYQSPQHMWADVCGSVAGQVRAMILFIEKNNLVCHLKSLNWHKFARAYNGPAYRKNRYATKMAAAYARHSRGEAHANNNAVREWQGQIAALGYDMPVNGRPKARITKDTVMTFQRDHGLVVDGIVGPMTLEAIEDALQAKHLARSSQMKAVVSSTGTGIAISEVTGQTDIVKNVLDKAEEIEGVASTLSRILSYADAVPLPWLLAAALIAAGGYLTWSYFQKSRGTDEGLFA